MCPGSAAGLNAISAGEKVAELNTRTWTCLQEGQGHTHTHSHSYAHVAQWKGLLDAVLRASVCTDIYLMRFDVGVL